MDITSHFDEDKIFSLIHNIYEEFKTFICCLNMPLFSITLSDKNDMLGMWNFDELYNNNYNLFLNANLFSYNSLYIKSILFHEFTHLYDYINIKNIYHEKDIIRELMNTYSEYHASQIELLSQMNVKTIKSVSRKIPNKYMIQGKDSCITINDYILYPLANAFDILNSNKECFVNYNKYEFAEICNKAQKFMIYYFGKLDIANKYVQKIIPDVYTINKNIFYKNLNNLHFVLSTSALIEKKYNLIKIYSNKYERDFYFNFFHNF